MKRKIKVMEKRINHHTNLNFLFIIWLMPLLFCSCVNQDNSKGTSKDNKIYQDITVILRAGNCGYQFNYNTKGYGTIVKGDVDNFESDSFVFTKILKKSEIKIRRDIEIKRVDSIIQNLKKIFFKRDKGYDGIHVQMYISNQKVIDSWGAVPDSFTLMQDLLIRNAAMTIKFDCLDKREVNGFLLVLALR
jgi:hypothetical protein